MPSKSPADVWDDETVRIWGTGQHSGELLAIVPARELLRLLAFNPQAASYLRMAAQPKPSQFANRE